MTPTRLLIAHPDPAARAMLDAMLHGPGYQISEATGADDALRALADATPHLLLVGIDGREPDALDLLSRIHRRHPALPSILLLPRPDESVSRIALRLGATAILRFPAPAHEVRAAIHQSLGWGESAGGAARPAPDPVVGFRPVRPERSGATLDPTPQVGEAEAVASPPCPQAAKAPGPLKEALEGHEREIIRRALDAFGGCRNATAEALEINRTTLYKKMRDYGLLHRD